MADAPDRNPVAIECRAVHYCLNGGRALLWDLNLHVRRGETLVLLGRSGSGKTTLLNTLTAFIDTDERVITCEDAAELQLQQPHVVRLETRPANIEGAGEVTQRDLVKNCLRMRPDRIIIGEVRGGEAVDMLQAMNTGHEGSMTTIHANSPREALTRLENMVGMTGINLPSRAVRTQIAGAVQLIVQVSRMRDGVRRIVRIMEVVGTEGDVITTQDLGQPAAAFEQPLGLGGHLALLQVIEKLSGALPLRLAHGLKDPGLGHPVEIAVDRRLPAGLHHVEIDCAGHEIGMCHPTGQATG